MEKQETLPHAAWMISATAKVCVRRVHGSRDVYIFETSDDDTNMRIVVMRIRSHSEAQTVL